MADFQTLNLAQIYGAADQANAQKQENMVRQYQLKKLQDADTEDTAIKGAYAFNPDGSLDRTTTLGNLYKINGQKGLELQQSLTKADAEASKNKREDAAANLTNKTGTIKYLRDVLAGVTDQPSYEHALGEAKSLGANVLTDGAPAQYDPDWVRGHIMDADTHITQSTPKYEKVDLGGKVQIVDTNPFTNPSIKGTQFDKTVTPDAQMTNDRTVVEGALNRGVTIRGQNMTDSREKEKLAAQSNPENIESMAQMIANGQMPAPTGYAAKSPAVLAIMKRVSEINPDFSATTFNTSKKASADFATGKTGNTVRSFNTAISHLNTLSNLSDALDNGNITLINKAANIYASQTGQAAPTNFDAAKKIVGDEIVKSIVGAGGGVADREEAAKTISAANSPAQLKGVINTYKDLMNGQLKGLKLQYEQSTGKNDFDRFLSPDSKAELAPKTPQASPLSITAPNGKTYTFKTQAQANEFKRQAGL
jgi:hypothetical protein